MSAWWAESFKLVLTVLCLWAKHSASLGKDGNRGGSLALAIFSVLCLDIMGGLRLFFGSEVMQRCLQSVWEDSTCYKGGKWIGELETVRSKHRSLCSQRGVSGAFSMHSIGKKIPFPYFFLLNCSRVLPGKDSDLPQWSLRPFDWNNTAAFSRHP